MTSAGELILMGNILEVNNLKTYFYNSSRSAFIRAVDDLSFEVKFGEIVGILGGSGSGKTSLAHSIVGIVPESPGIISGEVWFNDGSFRKDLLASLCASCSLIFGENGDLSVKKELGRRRFYDKTMKSIRGLKIALIPQGAKSSLSPYLKVKDQIYRAYRAYVKGNEGSVSSIKAVDELISILDLRSLLNEYPHSLSGGECQRVAIGIALVLNPSLLIADEPVTGLDTRLQTTVSYLLEKFANGCLPIGVRNPKRGVILISHDEYLIRRLAHRVVLIKEGKKIGEKSWEKDWERDWEKRSSFQVFPPDPYPILKAENVCFEYPLRFGQKLFNGNDRSSFALRSISFEIHRAEIVGIIGESGCGKTTLGKAISGLLPHINSGMVEYDGKNIYSSSYDRIGYRKRTQMIFQNPESSLNMRMRVDESLIEAVMVGTAKKLKSSEAKETAMNYLYYVELHDKSDRHISDLSGGERRRLGIARAFAVSPELIVADETFSGVDSNLKSQLIDLFFLQRGMKKLTYVFILHDIQTVRQICETVMVIHSGRIVEWGRKSEIFSLGSTNHPYTSAILRPFEKIDMIPYERYERHERVGCEFRQSCWIYKKLNLAQRKRCQTETPALKELSKNHKVACNFLG